MHFPNTTAMMKDLQYSQGIRLEQVMQLIEKLFSDIQYQTGDLVEDCQIGNMNQLIPTLSAVTNDIVFIFRNHEKEITDAEHKYFGSLTNAQSACSKCLDQLNTARQALQSLEEEEVKLIEQQKEAELLLQDKAQLEQKVRALQAQIRNLTPAENGSEAAQLQQTIVSLQAKLDTLTADFTGNQVQYEKLKQDIADKQADIARILNEIQACNQTNLQLDEQLEKYRADKAQLEQDIADKQQQVREYIAQLNQKTEQLSRIQAVINQHIQSIAQAEAEFAQLSLQEEEKKQEADLALKKLEVLKRSLESLEKSLTESQNDYRNTEARLNHAQESLQEAKNHISDTQKRIQEAEQELSNEHALAESMKAKLFTTNSDVAYQKQDNELYRKNVLEPAEAELTQLKEEAVANHARSEDLKISLSDAKNKRTNIVSQNHLLEQYVAQAQQKLAEQEALLQTNTQQLATLEAAVREKARAVTSLINRQNELHTLLNGRDTDQIQKDLEEKNQQLAQDIRKADELEATIREITSQLDISRNRLAKIQDELNGIRSKEQALQAQYDDVSAQLDQANSEENRSRSAKMQNQLDILRGLAEKLSAGNAGTCGNKFLLEQHVCENLNQAEQTIQTIRQVICKYADQRQSVLETRD